MKPRHSRILPILPLLLVAGCERVKPESRPTLVPEPARSAAFFPTVEKLDMGGPVFLFAETDGDPKRVADALLSFAKMAAEKSPDPGAAKLLPDSADGYLGDLGLDNIHAVGVSSRKDGTAFVNKQFLLTPGGPRGLELIFGEANRPFLAPELAPANTVAVFEGCFEARRATALFTALAIRAKGQEAGRAWADKVLRQPLPNSPYTAEKILERLDGRAVFALAVEPGREVAMPGRGARLPAPDFAVLLENRRALFDEVSALARMAGEKSGLTFEEAGDWQWMRVGLPAGEALAAHYSPVFAAHKTSGRVIFASRPEVFRAWTGEGPRLSATADFKAASAGMAAAGTSFAYVSPEIFPFAQRLLDAIGAMTPDREAREGVAMTARLVAAARVPGAPGLCSTSRLLSDGILSESRSPYSEKPSAYLWAVQRGGASTVVASGMMAALAIPAFKKVRNNAIEKAMINDARQISSAANQYWAENATTSARVKDLRDFFPRLSSGNAVGVAGGSGLYETYDYLGSEAGSLEIRQGGKFILKNPDYDRALSTNPLIRDAAARLPKDTLVVDADTGMIVAP